MRRHLTRTALTISLGVVCAATLNAQRSSPATYRFGSDTLRYTERTVSRVTIQRPSGDVLVKSSHDADIGIRGIGEGRAEAWYDRIALRQEGPGPAIQEPATAALTGQPFTLVVTANGQVQTQTVPAVPTTVSAVTDLSREFDDFFVTLPTRALEAGVTWTDTVVRTRGATADSASSTRNIRSYRVERDTSIAGARAVVISVHQLLRAESTAPTQGRKLLMRTRLEGEESGSAVFVVSSGRLYARERRGTLAGELTVTGGPQPATFPQRFEYTSTLSLKASSR